MFIVNPDKSIYITRGDIGMLVINAEDADIWEIIVSAHLRLKRV